MEKTIGSIQIQSRNINGIGNGIGRRTGTPTVPTTSTTRRSIPSVQLNSETKEVEVEVGTPVNLGVNVYALCLSILYNLGVDEACICARWLAEDRHFI